jgi:hypothetical protein
MKHKPAEIDVAGLAVLFGGGAVLLLIVLMAFPSKREHVPMKKSEYVRGEYWCHMKTVCCDASRPETCATFESCRKPGADRQL